MNPRTLTPILLATLFTVACTSPQKLVENGDYDEAISLSVRKLAGKKNKKEVYIQALEEAFARANERDLREADRLKLDGDPGNWERVYDLYRRIQRRQDQVAPLLPLAGRYGLAIHVDFIDVDDFLRQAQRRAAEYLYTQAQQDLLAAEAGDRRAAREAYEGLRRTERYVSGPYRDRDALLARARELGTTYVLVAMSNETYTPLPPGFEREVLAFNPQKLNDAWRQYHLQPVAGVDYDYRVELRLQQIQVSPTLIREREYEETCDIEDGFDYVLDERGNVRKDSLGNDIKVPRKVRIRAQVLETYQHKAALVLARVEVYEQATGRLLDSRPVTAEAVFENRAGRFRGDERALSKESRRLIRQPLLPFPTDIDLLFDTAARLRPAVTAQLDRSGVMI